MFGFSDNTFFQKKCSHLLDLYVFYSTYMCSCCRTGFFSTINFSFLIFTGAVETTTLNVEKNEAAVQFTYKQVIKSY